MPFANITETTDAVASTSTAYTMSVGDTFSGTLTTGSDEDWIRINLVAGETYQIDLSGVGGGGGTLSDPYLYLMNSSGTQVAFNDDISYPTNRDSSLTFTATTTGSYYIDAASYGVSSGTYTVSVASTASTAGTFSEMATYLTDGYWNDTGRSRHSFDTSSSNVITVDLTGLTADGRQLARWAFDAWENVADIVFNEVTSGADITFDDNQSGAFANYTYSGSTTVSANVNVSTTWLNSYGTTIDSYSFGTYIHEIGHALGLGHQGNYNGSATYGVDDTFTNDSWQTSVMSYFSQTQNTTVNADYAYYISAMMVDIIAIQDLYGAAGGSSETAGNTVYGVGSNLGGYLGELFGVFSGGSPTGIIAGTTDMAFTFYDVGGIDTINFNMSTTDDNISLRGGAFSDIGGAIGSMGIAVGTVIENYISGSGHDVVVGNGVANRLHGNAGNDTLYGAGGNDRIFGGGGGDWLYGGNGNDRLFGHAGVDRLFGGNGADTLRGGGHADRLYGGGHADRLYGGNGNDILNGGSGGDLLTGGLGNDVFVFTNNMGNDTITDFSRADDLVRFYGTTLNFAALNISYSGGNATVDYGSGTIQINGIAVNQLTAADFDFI